MKKLGQRRLHKTEPKERENKEVREKKMKSYY